MNKMISPPWLNDYPIIKLLSCLSRDPNKIRFVGGCVRDSILRLPVKDIDLATSYLPDETMNLLIKNEIKVVASGLSHGTVTAIVARHPYEITSLRKDIETDGRHAKVKFTTGWFEDAGRRDFTFNALYMDADGFITDYFNGVQDLENGVVRFIGDPDKRIAEDYLRILRFYRFWTRYGRQDPDPETVHSLVRGSPKLTMLSAERIYQEVLQIFSLAHLSDTLPLMLEHGALAYLWPTATVPEGLKHYFAQLTTRGLAPHPQAVIAAMSDLDMEKFTNVMRRLKAAKAHIKWGKAFIELCTACGGHQDLETALYYNDREVVKHWQVFCGTPTAETLRTITEWQQPEFPLTGEDLQALGIPPSKHMGRLLRALKTQWVEAGFRLSRATLIERAKACRGQKS